MSEHQINRERVAQNKARYNRRPASKFLVELALRTSCWAMFGRKSAHPERTRGLIDGAILGSDLSYPDTASDEPRLRHKRAPAGRWTAFDFNRPLEFPIANQQSPLKQVSEGRLMAFILDEIRENPPEQRTPTSLFDITKLDHLFEMDTPTIDVLTENGLVKITTHGEAYENVGLYDTYGRELAMRGVENDPVFQVTPKGNTLVNLIPDMGKREPKESTQKSLNWLPGLRPSPIVA